MAQITHPYPKSKKLVQKSDADDNVHLWNKPLLRIYGHIMYQGQQVRAQQRGLETGALPRLAAQPL